MCTFRDMQPIAAKNPKTDPKSVSKLVSLLTSLIVYTIRDVSF